VEEEDEEEEEEEEEEYMDIDAEWDFGDEYEWDYEWMNEFPYSFSKIWDAFGDMLADDETVSISPKQCMKGITDLFDFFRKEVVFQNPSEVTVYVRGV